MIEELKKFVGFKKRYYLFEVSKRFYHQPDTTVCVLHVAFNISVLSPGISEDDELKKALEKRFPDLEFIGDTDYMDGTIVGKSVCSNGDTFDEKLGETIAYSKAQKKAYSITSRIAMFLSQYLEKRQAMACRIGQFMQMATEREENFVKSI